MKEKKDKHSLVYLATVTFEHPLARCWAGIATGCYNVSIACFFMMIFNFIGALIGYMKENSILNTYFSFNNFSIYLYWTIGAYLIALIFFTIAHMIEEDK